MAHDFLPHEKVYIHHIMTGIAETVPTEHVWKDETCLHSQFRAVYYEDQKSSHVEIAIV